MNEHLGKYELITLLGSGATSEVYQAKDSVLGRQVALKVLKPALVADPSAFERFSGEAQAASELFHPNIATVLDMGEADGRYFIALRFIEGKSLDQHLAENGPLTWDQALRMTRQIGDALDFAHKKNFLHRDVKPSNIIYSVDGDFVLTDFGLMRAMISTGLTSHTGAVLGTPPYIAPEIWEGKHSSPATDQYALACVLCEALTGDVLFKGDTPVAILTKHTRGAKLPQNWPDGLPDGLRNVLRKALAKDAQLRYESLGMMTKALETPTRGLSPISWDKIQKKSVRRDGKQLKDKRIDRIRFLLLIGFSSVVILIIAGFFIKNWLEPDILPLSSSTTETPWNGTPSITPTPTIAVYPGEIASSQGEAAVRENPTGEVIAYLQDGEQIEIVPDQLKRQNNLSWVHIQSGTQAEFIEGWVLASLINLNEPNINAVATPTLTPERDSMEMIYIPEGLFVMGSEDTGYYKLPIQLVYLNAYWIDKMEVTSVQYDNCVQVGACQALGQSQPSYLTPTGTPLLQESLDQDISPEITSVSTHSNGNYPVVHVSWKNAQEYCEWTGRRLPTEAEWEKAARGPWVPSQDAPTYPWGESIQCDKANYGDVTCGHYGLMPVGSFPSGSSPYGVMDMAGNVSEWVEDLYTQVGGLYITDMGEIDMDEIDMGNEFFNWMMRGGSWNNGETYLRSYYRNVVHPTGVGPESGFRCSRSAP